MTTQIPGHVPGSDQRADLRVVRDDGAPALSGATATGGGSSEPEQAIGLLANARRVADATVAEARDEAERLLTAARERAQQVQRDARELGQRLRADAERESAQVRHQAFGEAERIVADARAQVSQLESSVGGLQSARDDAVATVRGLVERLSGALAEHEGQGARGPGGDGPAGDGPAGDGSPEDQGYGQQQHDSGYPSHQY